MGEKVHGKHFDDNPHDSIVSIFCALGVWFCIQRPHFEKTKNLFQATEHWYFNSMPMILFSALQADETG